MYQKKAKIFCLVGGSGSGKDTIKNNLHLPYVVSYRTRPMRVGEEDGKDGYFVTDELYFEHKETNKIAAETVYNGYRYWTTYDCFRPYLQGLPILYVVDWPGVVDLKKAFPPEDIISIWIDVHGALLYDRMRSRGDSDERAKERLKKYHTDEEIKACLCDYKVNNNNNNVYIALGSVSRIILKETFKDSGSNG